MPHPPQLAQGEVHVWRLIVSPTNPADVDDLPDSDQERAAGYSSPQRAASFIAARRALRFLLGGYLGVAPRAIALHAVRHQKPRLLDPGPHDLRFNMAHRPGCALVAVASGCEVGVDLESSRTNAESEAIAATVLSPAEQAAIDGVGAGVRHTAILRAWTRREAVLKAAGSGLRIPPARIDVGDQSPAIARPVVAGGLTWGLWDLTPWPDAIGAVAAARTDITLRRLER